MTDEPIQQPDISAREKAGLAMMATGFAALVGGIACISPPWAAIVGGALLLAAGIIVDRLA